MIGAILVAGGVGQRMGSPVPKQFLPLHGRSIAQRSLDLLLSLPEIAEIAVVCHSDYRPLFEKNPKIWFADPGARRQDSVEMGLNALSSHIDLILVHDAVRPLLSAEIAKQALEVGLKYGAAVVAAPLVFTVKEVDPDLFVLRTLNRSTLWEIQTPQVVRRPLLEEGLQRARAENWEVTDDASLIERLGHPVKIVEGCRRNLKITTRDDLAIAEGLLA
jgi:2-C-methyl-D-erythritol 4-phosphate cytidylyltransferase